MTKIVLITMIRNESKIIRRMMETARPILDAIVVLDTGSTDNTIEVCKEIISDFGIPGKVYESPFINFAESRTQSFRFAKEFLKETDWDPRDTYGLLLDADMKLVLSKEFNKAMLHDFHSYMIKQVQNVEYYNIRFIRMDIEWECKGVTHEYWDVVKEPGKLYVTGAVEEDDVIWIDDVSDGGCKSDKFERDLRLLLKAVEEEPELRSRYYFYLGQTYASLNNYEKATEYYLKRIELSTEENDSEVFYSYNQLCKMYYNLARDKDPKYEKEMEEFGVQGYEYNKNRTETICVLAQYFLLKKDYKKAEKYITIGVNTPLPKKEILFLNKEVYTEIFPALEFQLHLLKKSEKVFEIGRKLMNIKPNEKRGILISLLPFFKIINTSINYEILEIKENSKNLSINRDGNLLIDDEVKDVNAHVTKIDLNGCECVCLTDANEIVIPRTHEFGRIVENKMIIDGKYEGVAYLGNGDFIKSLSPFETTLSENNSENSEFLSLFETELPASKLGENYYILLKINMMTGSGLVNAYCIVTLDKEGRIQKYSIPFFLNKVSACGICSFSMKDEKEATLIFLQDKRFFLADIPVPY